MNCTRDWTVVNHLGIYWVDGYGSSLDQGYTRLEGRDGSIVANTEPPRAFGHDGRLMIWKIMGSGSHVSSLDLKTHGLALMSFIYALYTYFIWIRTSSDVKNVSNSQACLD